MITKLIKKLFGKKDKPSPAGPRAETHKAPAPRAAGTSARESRPQEGRRDRGRGTPFPSASSLLARIGRWRSAYANG